MGPALKETTGQASPETKAPEAAKPGRKASEPKADIKKNKDAQAPGPSWRSSTLDAFNEVFIERAVPRKRPFHRPASGGTGRAAAFECLDDDHAAVGPSE
jgi:hypothetical protein